MASVTKLNRDGRIGYRVRFYDEGKRRELYLAGASKRVAEAVGRHCDELSKAKAAGVRAEMDSVKWANELTGNLRDRLVEWGLAEPVNPRLRSDEGRLLGPFVDAYIESRTDWKPNTVSNAKQAAKRLKEYFGERHPLRTLTRADAKRWARWLASDKGLAVPTIALHVKRAKTMFNHAVEDKLLPESPFYGLETGDESNPDRQRFIKPDVMAAVLRVCPDADWRLIFTLARFAGLRCPSEVLALRWTDIDWEAERLRIEAPKTGLRFCPMFPEVRVALEESFEVAPEGAVHCVGRYRSMDSNLRTHAIRLIEKAGFEPWPKLFVNLRSTRRTELQERFPSHVVNQWLGHSEAVAQEHYLQTTEEHWLRATEFRPPTGPPIPARREPSGAINGEGKPTKKQRFEGSGCLEVYKTIPPRGVEQVSNSLGNSGGFSNVPPDVPPSMFGRDSNTEELASLWALMDAGERETLLAVARGILSTKSTKPPGDVPPKPAKLDG